MMSEGFFVLILARSLALTHPLLIIEAQIMSIMLYMKTIGDLNNKSTRAERARKKEIEEGTSENLCNTKWI
jgi:hypothetical protein